MAKRYTKLYETGKEGKVEKYLSPGELWEKTFKNVGLTDVVLCQPALSLVILVVDCLKIGFKYSKPVSTPTAPATPKN